MYLIISHLFALKLEKSTKSLHIQVKSYFLLVFAVQTMEDWGH